MRGRVLCVVKQELRLFSAIPAGECGRHAERIEAREYCALSAEHLRAADQVATGDRRDKARRSRARISPGISVSCCNMHDRPCALAPLHPHRAAISLRYSARASALTSSLPYNVQAVRDQRIFGLQQLVAKARPDRGPVHVHSIRPVRRSSVPKSARSVVLIGPSVTPARQAVLQILNQSFVKTRLRQRWRQMGDGDRTRTPLGQGTPRRGCWRRKDRYLALRRSADLASRGRPNQLVCRA